MKPEFITKIRVYFSDTDAVGIVYHANYLDFAERARTEICRACGLDLVELAKKNMFFVLRSSSLDYLAPAKLDDVIEVKAYISKFGNTSVEFIHEMYLEGSEKKICEVKCILVSVKMEGGKATPVPIPQEIKTCFLPALKS